LKSIKNLERLQQLHLLIVQECTGCSNILAQRMHISQRLVYNLIDQLKDFKANVCYDRGRKTYYYKEDFQFQVNISVQITSGIEVIELFQGSYC